MICSEAIADAEMDFALSADEVSLLALACSVAALSAVALLRETHRVMILSQCCTSRGRVRCTLRPSIGRQALHEFVSELHSEARLSKMMHRGRLELKGGGKQMVRLLRMHREHSEGRSSVLGSKLSCLLYSLCARVRKRRGRIEPKSAVRSQQCGATEKGRSEDNDAQRATAHPCAPAAPPVAAC